MSEKAATFTSDESIETPSENIRQIQIGNTTFEIIRHYSGTITYENIVYQAIKRLLENG